MIEFRTLGALDLRDPARAEPRLAVTQPKRLALLAYLAVGGGSAAMHRRDTLLGLLWPDADQERGRGALRQAIHALRRTLGEGAIVSRGDGEVGVDPDHLWCDAAEFGRLVDAGRPAEAIELYRGDLLPGLFVSGVPAFEEWLERARAGLRERATRAAWDLAGAEDARGSPAACHWARRAVALAVDDEAGVRRLMTLLANHGDTAGALHAYEHLVRRLARDYASAPAPETQRLAEHVRSGNWPAGLLPHHGSRTSLVSLQEGRAGPVEPHSAAITGESALVGQAGAPAAARSASVRSGAGLGSVRSWTAAAAAGAAVVVLVMASWSAGRRTGGTGRGQGPPPRRVAAADAGDGSASLASGGGGSESRAAVRLYEEGVRALALGDRDEAHRLFAAAVAEDSAYALAVMHLAATTDDAVAARRLRLRATRLAEGAPDEHRLIVLARSAAEADDPRRLAYAETLAVRYPSNPEGMLLYAEALSFAGEFARAATHFRRVITVDSAGIRGLVPACRGCDALEGLSDAYERMDSTGRAEAVARAWTRSQPRAPRAWKRLGYVLGVRSKFVEALAAYRTATDLGGRDEPTMRAEVLMRAGDHATADILMKERLASPDPDVRTDAHFELWMSLRDQGRYREALEEARTLYALGAGEAVRRAGHAAARVVERQYEATTLWEMGRPADAAALLDSMVRAVRAVKYESGARAGRAIANALAWWAGARAAAGDTAGLSAIADTVRAWGRLSAYGRDQRLHHYVRGLVLEARGDGVGAMTEFRRSLWSPTSGFVLANLALGRVAQRIGHPEVAIAALGGALRGPVGASGTRASKTELHAELAAAFDKALRSDSAILHYRRAVDAWEHADEFLRPRRARLALRLRELENAP